jgi:hypothetical protein
MILFHPWESIGLAFANWLSRAANPESGIARWYGEFEGPANQNGIRVRELQIREPH